MGERLQESAKPPAHVADLAEMRAALMIVADLAPASRAPALALGAGARSLGFSMRPTASALVFEAPGGRVKTGAAQFGRMLVIGCEWPPVVTAEFGAEAGTGATAGSIEVALAREADMPTLIDDLALPPDASEVTMRAASQKLEHLLRPIGNQGPVRRRLNRDILERPSNTVRSFPIFSAETLPPAMGASLMRRALIAKIPEGDLKPEWMAQHAAEQWPALRAIGEAIVRRFAALGWDDTAELLTVTDARWRVELTRRMGELCAGPAVDWLPERAAPILTGLELCETAAKLSPGFLTARVLSALVRHLDAQGERITDRMGAATDLRDALGEMIRTALFERKAHVCDDMGNPKVAEVELFGTPQGHGLRPDHDGKPAGEGVAFYSVTEGLAVKGADLRNLARRSRDARFVSMGERAFVKALGAAGALVPYKGDTAYSWLTRIGPEKEPGRWLYVSRETFTTPPEPLSCPRDPGPSDAPGGGSQADWIAWAAQLMDADETEGEPIDWLELTADETAARLEEVAKNGREIVSLKREIEDPDAPRWAPLAPPHDPTDPDAIETAAAWDRLQAEREAREALARGDVPELSAELLDRPTLGAFPVPAIAAEPVEAPASAPVVPAEAPEAPSAPSRRTKAPARRGAKAEAIPAKPRTKPESAPRGYVPLATDGRVIVAPDGSRRELPVPVEVLDAGHVAEAARELSAGRPAVVLVSARAHDALGLGDTWAPEPEASAAEALDAHPLAARAIARGVPVVLASTASGALAVGESHAERVEIDFPRWSGSGDFRAVETLDLDQLESAAVKFAAALGLTYATSGAATITHLIRNLSPKLGPAWLEPDLSDDSRPSWVRAKPGGGWSRKLTKAESGRPYVAVYDRSGSYASAWGGLVTGTGRWEQAGAVAELPGRDTPAGYWLVDVEPLRVALKLGSAKPDPFAKLGAPNGPQWLTTPLAQLARDLTNALGLDLRALDAYTQAAHGRALTKPAERIRAAREALALDPSPAARAALAIVKTGYSAALGWCEYSNRPPDPLARPYWNRAVIDRFGANAWRSLETAEPAPFAWVDIDACLFATGDSSMAPWPPEKIGPGFGCWKRKGALVSMKEAAPLLNAGNVQAVVALAEEKDK
jgi:hypothetical protein